VLEKASEPTDYLTYFSEKYSMNYRKIALVIGIAASTTLVALQPANAVLENTFEFTDIVTGDTITGEVTFNSLNSGDSATDVTADSVIITDIPASLSSLESTWGDSGGFQVNQNLLTVSGVSIAENSFDITLGIVEDASFEDASFSVTVSDGVGLEIANLFAGGETWLQDHGGNGTITDGDDTYGIGFDLQFSAASASVPFEFSPSLGLIMVMGAFSVTRIRKNLALRQTR
jgi:hypothetical protein